MNRSTVVSVLFWSVTIGGLIAIFTGSNRAISLRVWLAVFASWFALAVLKRLFVDVPLLSSGVLPVVTRNRARLALPPDTPRELRALRGLLLRSRDNDRAFVQQLRPRLVAITDHFMLVHHGIDRHEDPERASQLLGGLAWIVDDQVHDRTPTSEELDRFVRILTGPTRTRTEKAS